MGFEANKHKQPELGGHTGNHVAWDWRQRESLEAGHWLSAELVRRSLLLATRDTSSPGLWGARGYHWTKKKGKNPLYLRVERQEQTALVITFLSAQELPPLATSSHFIQHFRMAGAINTNKRVWHRHYISDSPVSRKEQRKSSENY